MIPNETKLVVRLQAIACAVVAWRKPIGGLKVTRQGQKLARQDSPQSYHRDFVKAIIKHGRKAASSMQWTLNPVTTLIGFVLIVMVLILISNPAKTSQAGTGLISRYGLTLLVVCALLIVSMHPAVTHITSSINLIPTATPVHAAPIHHRH